MSPTPPPPLDPIVRLRKDLERCQRAHLKRDAEAVEAGDWRDDYGHACEAIEILLRKWKGAQAQLETMLAARAYRRAEGKERWADAMAEKERYEYLRDRLDAKAAADEAYRWAEVERLRRERECLLNAFATVLGVSESEAWLVARLDLEGDEQVAEVA